MLTKFALKAHVAVAKAFGDAVYQAASQTIDEIAARWETVGNASEILTLKAPPTTPEGTMAIQAPPRMTKEERRQADTRRRLAAFVTAKKEAKAKERRDAMRKPAWDHSTKTNATMVGRACNWSRNAPA
ncbi:unnamed protein product (mitochondrion) [Plasmodiophora brassicae]|uniref:Uncharacterized protein n=1 Tax=Plasmodiophora brassicae TaxID=37360 RepID=A0A3P3Y9N4_PLABS|nr:unnamed protein product [Plasmodiophora brassicae]